MPSSLVHGFKTLAERTAILVREKMGLDALDQLDCRVLADELGIPIVSVRELKRSGASEESVARLLQNDAGFSALTVCVGDQRLIVYNPAHPPGRQSNSLAHELAHVILEHPPAPAAFDRGSRYWNSRLEDEADWLAGALLVPREGALEWLRKGNDIASGAIRFGVSQALFSWRVNQTGVMRQLEAARQRTHKVRSSAKKKSLAR